MTAIDDVKVENAIVNGDIGYAGTSSSFPEVFVFEKTEEQCRQVTAELVAALAKMRATLQAALDE